MNDGRPEFPLSGSTRSSLLLRLRANDQEAWRIAVHLYEPLICYWFRQSGLPPDDWADVLQDIFRSVSQSIAAFQHNDSTHTFRGWLHTIARHKLADHFRSRQRNFPASGGTESQRLLREIQAGPSFSEEAAPESHRVVLRALEILKSQFETKTWTAFWRTAIDGLSATEVAEELGMSPEAVRKCKSRVLRRLKEEFGTLLE